METERVRSRQVIEAVQLTDDADWEAIAAWCGGKLRFQGSAPGDEPRTVLDIGYGYEGIEEDWVVRYQTEGGPDFAIYLPDQFEELFEVWPAGDRPTRDQLYEQIQARLRDASVPVDLNDGAYRTFYVDIAARAVLGLLHGQGGETDA